MCSCLNKLIRLEVFTVTELNKNLIEQQTVDKIPVKIENFLERRDIPVVRMTCRNVFGITTRVSCFFQK